MTKPEKPLTFGNTRDASLSITTLPEHIAVLGATAIQTALFVWHFLRWERSRGKIAYFENGYSELRDAKGGENGNDLAASEKAVRSAPVSKRVHGEHGNFRTLPAARERCNGVWSILMLILSILFFIWERKRFNARLRANFS